MALTFWQEPKKQIKWQKIVIMLLLLTAWIGLKHFGWDKLGDFCGGLLFLQMFWPFAMFLMWLLLPSRFTERTSSEGSTDYQRSTTMDRDEAPPSA